MTVPDNADGLVHTVEMLIGGRWQPAGSGRTEDVTSPFDGTVIGTVPVADVADVRVALDRAEAGAVSWRRTPAHERMRILLRAAELADERAEQTTQVISAEAGKTITEARGEASRSGDLIRLAAFEGTQLYGDALPLDANRGTGLDKLGFTIHQPVGIVAAITPFNYPALLVMHKLAPALAAGNAVVLKPARTTPLTALALARRFTDAGLPEGVLSVLTGPGSSLGDALVSDPRVRKVSFTGSTATGQHITQMAGIKKLSLELASSCPAVAVSSADDWESAIAQANGTPYGLGAGIFTSDVAGAVRAVREIDAGAVHINWTPLWRADLMPYGGLKASGIGKEGPRSAVAEMTDVKTVVLHGRPW